MQEEGTKDKCSTAPTKRSKNQKKVRQQRTERRLELAPYRQAIADAESAIDGLNKKKTEIQQLLATSSTYEDQGPSPNELLIRLAEIDRHLLLEEKKWVSAVEIIEARTTHDQ